MSTLDKKCPFNAEKDCGDWCALFIATPDGATAGMCVVFTIRNALIAKAQRR